jgi:adenylate cyclase
VNADPCGAIVFTDIVGFTELTAIHGDDAAVELLTVQDRLVRSALPAGARIVKEIGDGMLLWFASAAEALRTAVQLQARYRCVDEPELPLWVRIGIHFGCPRRRGDDIVGHDVNLASRVMGLAGAGEILCTRAVRDAASAEGPLDEFTFDPLGPVFDKGITDPVPVLRVIARAGAQP